MLRIAGQRLPGGYQRRLRRYRYGPGVFKVDYALDGPVPWKSVECSRAGTVHVGGTLAEIAAAEHAVWRGEPPENPFVLVAQQSLFDSSHAQIFGARSIEETGAVQIPEITGKSYRIACNSATLDVAANQRIKRGGPTSGVQGRQ